MVTAVVKSKLARKDDWFKGTAVRKTSRSKHFHSLDAGRRRRSIKSYQESKKERSRSRSHKTSSEKEVKREAFLAQEKKAVDPRSDLRDSGKHHKKKVHHQVRDDGSSVGQGRG